MKTHAILICAVCFVVYASVEVVRADDDVPVKCLEKLGIRIADIPKLITDQSEEALRKRACLEACIMQKIGLMNGNTIDMQKIDEHIDKVFEDNEEKEDVRQTVHQCADRAVNDDECLVAENFAACGLEQMKLRLRQLMNKIQ